jgi:hypothetical protein
MRVTRSLDAPAPPPRMGVARGLPAHGPSGCFPHSCFGCCCSRCHHGGTSATGHDCSPRFPRDSFRDFVGDVDGTSFMVPQLGVPAAQTPPRTARWRWRVKARRTSGHGAPPNANPSLSLWAPRLGHSSPHLCPTHCPRQGDADPLGTPLSIGEVASLVGCSVWTVRQKYLPAGLPYFRLGSTGKLIFYRNQVIRWMLARQQKGGMTK